MVCQLLVPLFIDLAGYKLTSQPIGLFLVLEISSISFQSRLATNARNLQERSQPLVNVVPDARGLLGNRSTYRVHHATFSGTLNSLWIFLALPW